MISLLGFAPSYSVMLFLLFHPGISVAAFHAPAPALVGRLSGKKVGLGMSLFMAGGEMAFTSGPCWRYGLCRSGHWMVSGARYSWVGQRRLFSTGGCTCGPAYGKARQLALDRAVYAALVLAAFGICSVSFPDAGEYLDLSAHVYETEGASLILAGVMFSVVQLAGVGGVLLSGPLSDRLGRKWVLSGATLGSAILMLLFINSSGWIVIPLLLGMGFLGFEHHPCHAGDGAGAIPQKPGGGERRFYVDRICAAPSGHPGDRCTRRPLRLADRFLVGGVGLASFAAGDPAASRYAGSSD